MIYYAVVLLIINGRDFVFMKKHFIIFSLLIGLLCGGVCRGSLSDKSKVCPDKKLKTGFYVDNGSRGNGAFTWAQLLFYSPQLEVTLLDGKDIRDGKLDNLDLLVVPGGSGDLQLASLQDSGRKKVRDFVRNGGAYVGVCAGFHSALANEGYLQIMPYKHRRDIAGTAAVLPVVISKEGASMLGINPGRHYVRYNLGPISIPAQWNSGKAKTLGVYQSSIGYPGKPDVNFYGAPALIYGTFGKGKVIAASFHPESNVTSHPLALGCIYAVTGIKPAPVFPKRNYRPVRVAFWTPNTVGKAPMLRMLELDRHPDIDLMLTGKADLNAGILDHVDVLVIPDAFDNKNIDFAKSNAFALTAFMDKGGKLLVSGVEAKAFPKHKNLVEIPAGKSFVNEALKKPGYSPLSTVADRN